LLAAGESVGSSPEATGMLRRSRSNAGTRYAGGRVLSPHSVSTRSHE
jgi:hypothetical protein